MLPVALTSVLAEGYLFFRRALLAYDYWRKIEGVYDVFDQATVRELRNHRVVVGEEVYLYILGRASLSKIYASSAYTSSELSVMVCLALSTFMRERRAFDVTGSVVEFGYILGQIAQTENGDFITLAKQKLQSSDGKYFAQDPVHMYMQATTPQADLEFFARMGISPSAWGDMVNGVRNSTIDIDWVEAMEAPAAARAKPHKSQNFFGLLIRGAESIEGNDVETLAVTGGTDALFLSFATLLRPVPLIPAKPRLRDDRSITKQMVDSVGARMMASRGYVYIKEEGMWFPVSETYEESETNREGKTIIKRSVKGQIKDTAVPSSGSPLVEVVEKEVEAQVKRKVRSTLDALAKSLLTKVKR